METALQIKRERQIRERGGERGEKRNSGKRQTMSGYKLPVMSVIVT